MTRCLAKKPAERWQHAQDVAFELTEIQERIVERIERPAATRRSDRRGLLPAAIVAGLLGLMLWSFVPSGRPVIVLMDSPGRVYDAATEAAGGTNADGI